MNGFPLRIAKMRGCFLEGAVTTRRRPVTAVSSPGRTHTVRNADAILSPVRHQYSPRLAHSHDHSTNDVDPPIRSLHSS